MKLIDFRTHLSSRPLFLALAREGAPDLRGPDVAQRAARTAERAGLELPSEDLADLVARWLDEADRHGVDQMVVWAGRPEENEAVVRAQGLSSGRLLGLVELDPARHGRPDVEPLFEGDQVRGVVLSPGRARFALDGEPARELLAAVERHGRFALVRCGVDEAPLHASFGLPCDADLRLSNPLALIPAAHAFPGATFVLSQLGAGFVREALMVGRACPNVLLEVSPPEDWIATQVARPGLADLLERALEVFGVDRLVFGSGSATFPQGWRHDRRTEVKEALGACGLAPEDVERVFCRNAERVLRGPAHDLATTPGLRP